MLQGLPRESSQIEGEGEMTPSDRPVSPAQAGQLLADIMFLMRQYPFEFDFWWREVLWPGDYSWPLWARNN